MLERPEHIRMFVEQILHGDDEHRDWLKEAGECFIHEKPMPAPRGGSKVIDQLIWSEEKKPDENCSYDHCTAKTPIGTYSIERLFQKSQIARSRDVNLHVKN